MAEPNEAARDGAQGLFSQLDFHIITSQELSETQAEEIRTTLLANGAREQHPPSKDGACEIKGLTHVITATIDFEGYRQFDDNLINIVTPRWVGDSLAKRKLANPKQFCPDPRMFFTGLLVTIAEDVPVGDKDAIIGGVLAMGGLYSSAISRTVTHVVALSTAPMKCKIAIEKNLNCKLVLPHWFDDCLKLQSRIDETPYTLPGTSTADGNPRPISNTSRPDLATSMHIRPDALPEIDGTDSQRAEKLSVFKERKILLAQDLEISKHLRSTLEQLFVLGGGSIAVDVDEADTYVCQYRQGPAYRSASTAGKTVGNLLWVYHLIVHNEWTDPMRRLLHYPFVRSGLPGFDQYRLSLSNYSGEARIYLENLAKAAGCEFTKAFKPNNTHLITAHKQSEKCDAASEWGVHIVNHLWLEESYAKWQIQPLTNARYTHFPDRTNLSEVVGQTRIDQSALEKYFYPKSSRAEAVMVDSEEEDAEDLGQPDDDVYMTANGAEAGSQAGEHSEAQDVVMQDRGTNDVQTPVKAPRKASRPPRSAQQPKTPAMPMKAEGKENETPVPTGGRSAKQSAAARLHDMAGDIQLFQKELKRVGGVTHGGKKSKDSNSSELSTSRKRSTSAEDGPLSEDELGEPQKKKAKPAAPMRLMITGWDNASNAKAQLRDLGIMLIEDYTKCSHVAAGKIVRTKKFMCALAYAPKILSTAFVEECLKQGQLLNADDFPLRDKEGEKKYNVSLQKSLQKAQKHKHKLLENMTVYVTKDIHGGFETYEAIIKANGGEPLMYQARPGAIRSRRPESTDSDEPEAADDAMLYLIRGDTPAEAKLGEKFTKAATSAHWTPKVVGANWLLDSALAQELKTKFEEYEL